MDIFMYFLVFLAFFHIILTLDTREIENIPINVEVDQCQFKKTGNYLNCNIRCKSGYKLNGATNIYTSVVSKTWKYINNREVGKLPINLEVYNCQFKKTGNFLNCNTRCKKDFKLKGATNINLSVVSKKWMYIAFKPTCNVIEKELINCPYPPKLPLTLKIMECIEKNGRKSNCTLSCKNKNYVFMNGYNEIFCNMETGKWVQENSTYIATTCQQTFDCDICKYLNCPSTTDHICSEYRELCWCGCPNWNSCDEFKCPLSQPESYCIGTSRKLGRCSCR